MVSNLCGDALSLSGLVFLLLHARSIDDGLGTGGEPEKHDKKRG